MRKNGKILTILSLLFAISLQAVYSQSKSVIIKDTIVLEKSLAEISGMADNGIVYAVNDSGNGNILYVLDPITFRISDEIEIKGAVNTDWESLALFRDTVYIGNFGNNLGRRKDLSIYAVPIKYKEGKERSIREINIKYKEQTSLFQKPYNHPFDCEAMVADSNGLWLFSKDWESRLCKLYRLAYNRQEEILAPVDSLYTGYLVTGAHFDRSTNKIFLCGYENKLTYLSIIDCGEGIGFKGNCETFIVEGLDKRQIESVFVRENNIYLASESTRYKQAVYIVEIQEQQ